MRCSHLPVAVVLVFAGALASCSSPPPIPAEQIAAEEQRLLSPYQSSRTVMTDHLTIEISANFDAEVSRPAVSPAIHDFERTTEGGDVVLAWKSRGGIQAPLKFQVGATNFAVLNGATLRVRGSGKAFALAATATGHVTESTAGAGLVDCAEIQIQNGRYHRR